MVFKYPVSLTIMNPLRKLRQKAPPIEDQASSPLINKDQLGIFNESLIDTAVRNFGLTSIVSTQEAFFKRTGKIFADDPFYDIRVSYFFDILIYEDLSRYHEDLRKKILPHKTLFDFIVSTENHSLTEHEQYTHYRQLITPVHSIYKVLRVEPTKLVLKDCFSKKIYPISNQKDQLFSGITRGGFLQGFIFSCKEGFTSSIGIIVHPKRCNSIIKQSINHYKSAKHSDPRSLLDRLAFAQLQQFRMKHVNPYQIYKGIILEGNTPSLS